jgi:predicted ATPase
VNAEFLMLGPLEVRVDGEPVTLRGGKPRALLTALLLEPGRTVATETLIDCLWGESPPARAANTLQVYVSQLRKALPDGALVTDAHGYRLAVAEDALDSKRFERLASAGRAALAAGNPHDAAARLREALALWRGAALADLAYESFAQNEARRLEEFRLSVLEDLFDAELAAGKGAEVVPELERLVAQEPLRERPRGQLMLALYRSGRQADALDEYQRARKTLVDELGIDPSPELQRLERAILTQDASLVGASRAAGRMDLPAAPTPLVGRERELEEAQALLAREDVRLLTLTGPGGIGKTRLALEIARRSAENTDAGAVFVGLATVNDPALVPPAIAQALGVSEASTNVEAALEAGLRDRPPLLVLDNFEQVVDAGPFLSRLLAAAPGLRLVVTSRAVLHLSGEHEFPVPPLGAEEAVDLFVQRAQAVRRDFEGERREIEELCTGLDRMPLAIELAAARVKLLSPAAMLERLGERLELLASGPRDAPARQQALRATIDWSYDLLDEDERRFFRRLGVFVGGCTLEAAEVVCGDGSAVIEGLASLVDKSLVRLTGADGSSRFSMLQTIREYALGRLAESGEDDAIRRRHLAHYSELAAAAEEKLDGPDATEWAERVELEHGNLRAAIEFALASGDGDTAVMLCSQLIRFWEYHGYLHEGRRVTEAALEAAANPPAVAAAKAWNGAGILAGEQGDFEAARKFFDVALGLARDSGDPKRISAALTNLGNIDLYRRDYEGAQAFYEEANKVALAGGLVRQAAIARENLGLVLIGLGELGAAVQVFEETLATAREVQATHDIAVRLGALARALIERGETERPRELLTESLELTRELKEPRRLADCLEAIGGLAVATGDATQAATLFGSAAALRESIGGTRPPDQEPWFERVCAQARAALGDEFDAEFARGKALPREDSLRLAGRVGAAA